MVLGGLEDIFDIEFKPDIDIDISDVNLVKIDKEDKFHVEGSKLEVNLEELSEQERNDVIELASEQVEKENRVLRAGEDGDVRAIEEGYDENCDEVLDYFEDYLSDRYLSVIEMGLNLRVLIGEKNLRKEEIHQRKRDIAQRYGPECYYLASLTTAGYFHRDGGLRNMLFELELNEGYSRSEFMDILADLVDKKLLCVFIGEDEDPRDATNTVRNRLSDYQDEEPFNEWLDIRGVGPKCEEIIDEVVANLQDDLMEFDYEKWTDNGEVHIRIYPYSLPQIPELG